MPTSFDAVVIGMGQAGPSLAARLSAQGMRVARVEKDEFGGTCVNNGCTPTKAMVASAYAAHLARRAGDYGVALAGAPSVRMERVKARKDKIVGDSREGLEHWMQGLKNAKIYRGHARFIGAQVVEEVMTVSSSTAGKIFIDVGGRPLVPNMAGVDSVPYLTNVTMMDLEVLPEHLIVIRGQLCGTGVCPDVQPLRESRNRRGDGAAPCRT